MAMKVATLVATEAVAVMEVVAVVVEEETKSRMYHHQK